jgi:hypothetical protein
VRRAVVLLALLAALATAASAAAKVPKTAIGSAQPIAVYATVNPPVQTFGSPITARVTVLADTTLVNPARLRVLTSFAPFHVAHAPTVVKSVSGRVFEETLTWSISCFSAACVPTVPPSDVYHFIHISPARVHVVGAHDAVLSGYHAFFPAVEIDTNLTPGIVNYLKTNKAINWQYQLAPGTASRYGVSPSLVFWAALALAGLLAAAGLFLVGRWLLQLRAPATATPALPASYLERALAVFFWANAHGDETLQRKALERVAGELPLDVIDLSDVTRKLAWSPEAPEEDEVEAISERAGVPAHHEDGAGE